MNTIIGSHNKSFWDFGRETELTYFCYGLSSFQSRFQSIFFSHFETGSSVSECIPVFLGVKVSC